MFLGKTLHTFRQGVAVFKAQYEYPTNPTFGNLHFRLPRCAA
jgi:hypothetical protein